VALPAAGGEHVEGAREHGAAGELGDQGGGPLGGPGLELGIDAALEAVGGVRVHTQRLGGGAHRGRVEPGALQEHVPGRARHLARGAAHDAGEGHRPAGVGDHQHAGGELPRLAVQGHQAFAGARLAHPDGRAHHLREVEAVERLARLPQDVIGHVDHVVDRAQADGAEAPGEPLGRRAHRHAADHPGGVARAELRRLDRHLDRAGGRLVGFVQGDLGLGEGAAREDRHLPGDSQVVHGVDPVGGDVDVEDGFAALGRFDPLDRQARRGQAPGELRRVGGQVDVVGEPLAGEEHVSDPPALKSRAEPQSRRGAA
jgi:hypothetical protein